MLWRAFRARFFPVRNFDLPYAASTVSVSCRESISGCIRPTNPGLPTTRLSVQRGLTEGIFRVANLRDIIASKQASGRQKDLIELPLLETFRLEFEKRHARTLRTAAEISSRPTSPPATDSPALTVDHRQA
jgi:hypothetical protein